MTRYLGGSAGWVDLATGLIVPGSGTGPVAPASPTGLAVSNLAPTSLTLTWTPSAAGGITEQRIYQDSTRIVTLAAGVTSYAVTGLTASTSYDFNVTAFDGTTNSPFSTTVTATTTTPTDPPATGSDLTLNAQPLTLSGATLTMES